MAGLAQAVRVLNRHSRIVYWVWIQSRYNVFFRLFSLSFLSFFLLGLGRVRVRLGVRVRVIGVRLGSGDYWCAIPVFRHKSKCGHLNNVQSSTINFNKMITFLTCNFVTVVFLLQNKMRRKDATRMTLLLCILTIFLTYACTLLKITMQSNDFTYRYGTNYILDILKIKYTVCILVS